MLIVRPPSELGLLAVKIELFDSSSSSIFITSNEYKQQNFAVKGKVFRAKNIKIELI